MGLLRRRSGSPSSPDAAWSLTEDADGTFTRRNVTLEAHAGDPDYDHALVVQVELGPCDEDALARLGGFEEALFGILADQELCWPAAVRTTGEHRRFLLYTRDPSALAEPLAFLKREYPVAFEVGLTADRGWEMFRAT